MKPHINYSSFTSYCQKYNISTIQQSAILRSFDKCMPDFKQREKEYPWQKEGNWGYEWIDNGKKFRIELGNWPNMNNVTFIGVEGMNI